MENRKPKTLSPFVFNFFLVLIFLRPLFSGLAYPGFELLYESLLVYLFIVAALIDKRPFISTAFTKSILVLIAAYLLSSFISSINLKNSLLESLKLITYFFLFMLVSKCSGTQRVKLVKTVVFAAALISVYSIYQYFFGYKNTVEYLERIGSNLLITSSYAKDIFLGKRAIGTFPSPTLLGGYLGVVFFLSISAGRDIILQKKFFILSFILLTALILTKSMGCWVAVIASIVLLLPRSLEYLRKKKFRLITFILLMMLALAFIIITRWERLMDMENPQNSLTQRINYWKTAALIIKDHFIWGVGPGNFQEVFLDYKTGLSTDTRYAHNAFLHTWAEAGIFAFAALISVIFIFLKKCRSRKEKVFIFLAGTFFILHNIIDNSYFIPQVGFLWWVLLGLSVSRD